MKTVLSHADLTRACLLGLLVALAVATTASASARGVPPSLGKLCGQVKGAPWQFQGKKGTQYNVTGVTAACSAALKAVGALTRQTPHPGVLGNNTLVSPGGGFQCAGSGIPLAHAGFCGKGAKHFFWAPQLP